MKKLLDSIVEKYDLKNRTWEAFGNRFDKFLLEESEESAVFGIFDRDSLESNLESVSYRIFEKSGQETIILRVNMCYHGGSDIGFYKASFSMEGELLEDNFYIDYN